MKDKIKNGAKILGYFLIAAMFFYGLFNFVDVVLDRKVGDWFSDRFLYLLNYGKTEYGTHIIVPRLDWYALKSFIVHLAMGLVLFWGITVLFTVIYTRKKAARETISKAEVYLRQSFSADPPVHVCPELEACVSDIKKQMQHKEQSLKDEESRKNDLIAYLAHDLKTPLTSVVGYLSLVDEAPDMPAVQKAKYVHISLEKALRLESLINEFFEITRYNLHEMVLEKEQIDLSYMLTQMADEFYPILMEHGNTVNVEAEDSLTVVADPIKLARVFNNILKNAIAYSDSGTPIGICAKQEKGMVRISISNRGRTIPDQKLQTIFEKFYRLDSARSTNTGGAGLGLAIAREIVDLHGGKISAVSQNQITTFRIELPQ